MSCKTVPLYGGAIAVDLPTTYTDASRIRQIPDHQEVFLDSTGYGSVIFEILEYVEAGKSDEAALQHHFEDLVATTGDATSEMEVKGAAMGKMPTHPTLLRSFIQTPIPNPSTADRPRKTPSFVYVNLLLLRLKEQKTDILITINAPHYEGEYVPATPEEGGRTQLMRDADEVRTKVEGTFEVREWTLFKA